MPVKKAVLVGLVAGAAYLDAAWNLLAIFPGLAGFSSTEWAALPPGPSAAILGLFAVNSALKLAGAACIGGLVWSWRTKRPLSPKLHQVCTFGAVATIGFLAVSLLPAAAPLKVAIHGAAAASLPH